MLELVFFILLIMATFLMGKQEVFFLKKLDSWILDLLGLSVQGTLIPIFQVLILSKLYGIIWPAGEGVWELNSFASFLLNFVFVDYLYYWNHRLLHSNKLWGIHRVHHTIDQMDIFVTSRNTLWSSFFIIYLWMNSFFIFFLKDAQYFIYSMALTACLDLWRHSEVFPLSPFYRKILSKYFLFVTPVDHSWHHTCEKVQKNFGANLNIFDKVHGTYYQNITQPKKLGIPANLTLWEKLFFPFRKEDHL
jgi:sterol desaturase/sphingolipid hydroxylase (fatty acid hydroxylase superfamily)